MSASVKNVQVDRRCFQVFVSKQVLNGSDVIAILKQMGSKRVAEGMRCNTFFDVQFFSGSVQCYSDILC